MTSMSAKSAAKAKDRQSMVTNYGSDKPKVYISSRGRVANVQKVVPLWHNQGFDIFIAVEPDEFMLYAKGLTECGISYAEILPLPKANQGLAYNRRYCVTHAASFGWEAIVATDDDIKPVFGVSSTAMDASHPKALGITIRYSYHDLALGPKIKKLGGIILQPNGMFRMVALNVANVMKVGNYDPAADNCEDADLMMRGLQAGFPWMVDLDSKAASMGKRHEPGGSLDYINAIGRSVADHTHKKPILQEKFPEVISSNSEGKTRVAWLRAHDLFLPGWRKWSDLHGGDIGAYLEDV
jgi:hypothetical protein